MFTIVALHKMFLFIETQKNSSYEMKQNFLASIGYIQPAHKGSESAALEA